MPLQLTQSCVKISPSNRGGSVIRMCRHWHRLFEHPWECQKTPFLKCSLDHGSTRVGCFKYENFRLSTTSHFSDDMWEMGWKHLQSPLPFTSQMGCGKISRPDILGREVWSLLKVGSGTQTWIPVFKISNSDRGSTNFSHGSSLHSHTESQMFH